MENGNDSAQVETNTFLAESDKIMDSLDALCRERLSLDPDKVFCFTYDIQEKRWRLFINYASLVEASKKA